MKKLKIAVIEDEMIIANNICDTLEEIGYDIIAPCISYEESIEMLETENPDLALLDIQLAGKKDGINLAKHIEENYSFPYIFLTSNSDTQTLQRVKELNPHAFLVKPFKKDHLFTAIELAISKFQKEKRINKENNLIKDAFFVKGSQYYQKVKYSEITYVKSEHNYLEIYTAEGKKHLHRNSFFEFNINLPKDFLFQVQRSFYVNPKFITAINATHLIVNKEKIPIGRKFKDDLMKRVSLV